MVGTRSALAAVEDGGAAAKFPNLRASRFSTDEAPTSREDVTSYNNFYELGTDKGDP
jgi:sulfoxide reductase catalytic subunit YedY